MIMGLLIYLMNTIANHMKTTSLKSQTLTIQAGGRPDNKNHDVIVPNSLDY